MMMEYHFYLGKIPGFTLKNSFSGNIMQLKGGKGAFITTSESNHKHIKLFKRSA